MPKWFGLILTVLIATSVAGCGGSEPAPTPTPFATVTPTVTVTPRPSATATATRTATPTATHSATPPATSTATGTPTLTPTGTDAPVETDTPTAPVEPVTSTPVVTATEVTTQTTTTALTETVIVTQSVVVTETVSVTQTAVLTTAEASDDGFTSPLAAPNSPLAVPPQETPDATPVVLRPVTGSWQLQSIRPSNNMTFTAAPAGYRVAFGPTGVVRVMADCKTGRGRYTSTADGALSMAITFSDVRCVPESLADPFGQALSQVTAYRYEGDQLLLTYGTQGGEMALTRTPQMSPLGAPFLHWSTLQNSTFYVPSVPAGDNQAPLVDGEFRALLAPATTPVPESAGNDEFVISLSTMHTYGVLITPSPEEIAADPEITAEVSTDTIAVLVIVNGADAPQSHLAPVLNGGGLPLSLQMELLGDNVLVRDLLWDGVQLRVDFEQDGKTLRHVYHFEDNHFVLDTQEELPPIPPKARLDLPAQPVTLGPAEAGALVGVSQASLTGLIATGEIHPYHLALAAGQPLSVTVQSPYNNVWLSIVGSQDRTVLRSIRSDTTSWAGSAPSGQEYLISAVAPGAGSPYTLTIQVAEVAGGQTSPPVAPTPTPEGKLIHLVIDGAALDSGGVTAPALLDLLQRNNASVDFFVDGAQAAQAGGAATVIAGAGQGLGVIAGPIRALTSDERDALFAEVSSARQALGEPAARCLRLPAAAGDAYTRAAAAELGFDVVQWDIDATEAEVSALLGQLFPGAVVRLNAGDGNSLAAGLQALLPALTQEGYSVRAMCR